MTKKMFIIPNKKIFFYISIILLIVEKYICQFCSNDKLLTTSFPNLDSEYFYLKRVTKNENDNYYIVGTEKEATVFQLQNILESGFDLNMIKKMTSPYFAYADSFGNIDPVIVGANTLEESYSIKYILTEGTTVENEFNHALYDAKLQEIREGKLSYGFDDFKILEPLNEKEYIGAIKLYDANTDIYSIKLQVMSFTQTSNGYIKQLSGKEYAETANVEQNVNNIYYIDSLKKILIIRTIQDLIYFDFIDYDSYFGTIQISKMIKAPFNVKEYRFYSVVLSKEEKKTYIASCFRKLDYLYCYSGYYDEEKVDFKFLQNEPKLMISNCKDKIYKNIDLYKLKSGVGIVGCSGKPYNFIRFNQNLEFIGSQIQFPNSYSEFIVVNSSTLFVMYSKEDTTDPSNIEYKLYGCIYYLPVCDSNQKFFINKEEVFNFEKIIEDNDELKNMKKINIIQTLPDSSGFYTESGGTMTSVDFASSNDYEISNFYYKNNGANSFEEKVYYNTIVNSGQAGFAKSQECVLSIVRCYKSCEKCDDVGNDDNNNCLECFNKEEETNPADKYYFIEDKTSKQCLPGDFDVDNNNVFFDNNLYKRCYSGCSGCLKEKDSFRHYCKQCDAGEPSYYSFQDYLIDEVTYKDCYLKNHPPEGYYFDKDTSKFLLCPNNPNNKCARCIQNLDGSIDCKRCKTNEGFYAYFEDDEKKNAECRNTVPDGGYFLDKKAGEYKKCYPSCATCSRSGSDEFNNCDTCKTDLEIYKYSIDSSTCKCKYNFYYKKDSETNKKTFTCTENQKCPNEDDNKYPYLMINSQNIGQCVSNCPEDFPYIYNYQCYDHIPNGTSLVDDSLYDCEDDNVNYDQCIINDYIKSSVPLSEISKVEKDYVNNYKNQYTNTGTSDYTYNHANMVRNNDDEYLLLIFQNEKCVEKITSEYGLGYTDLTDYSSKIKSENGIDEKEPLIYSYLYTYNPNGNETPVENLTYNVYNSDTGEKLNLDDVLEGENITQHVPAPTGADLQKLNYLSKYSDLGIDFSDPNSDFFNSQCFTFTSDSGKDVTLADRRKYFYNNIKICEDDCVFNGIDNATNTAKCSCPYKSSKSGGGETLTKAITFPDYKEDYFIYDMWKCLSKKMVEGKELKKSYITIIVFCVLLLTILFTVLYFCCFKNKFKFMSQISNKYSSVSRSSQSASQQKISSSQRKSNPPPKQDGEEDADSNLMKEKGYVHDVKRPFNYDNNNLFFHADEHYTIGNQNLNSLFMGQNFKNDYSENMEQLNNNEKKPKQVINNYNNVNIPGKKINKNKTKKPTKINNFNNINFGPDIVTINNSNPDRQTNKDKITRNPPLVIKNDSDIGSDDPLRKEKVQIKPNNFTNKNKKIKPDESSEKSFTNYSNKRSLISNKNNNSINGKIPENEKEDEFSNDMKNVCNEMGEENMKINKADYSTASQKDFRDFCSFYFNQLKHRQIFFYSTYFHKYAENIFMKIMIIFFHILLCLFLNLFWYRTYYVHSEFISPITNHSTFSSKHAWFRILLSVLFYIIIICLLHLIYLPQLKIYYSLSDDKLTNNEKLQIMEKNIKCMKINYIIFIVINFCFLIVLVLYTLVFSYVFMNSKTDLMISFILTVVITQALPFVFVFFVTVFRFIGLKCNCPCAYNFSLFFTI